MILSYARPADRAALAALLALDDTLADVIRTTREPMIGQMRMTWWHDAVAQRPAPAQPVLTALATHAPQAELQPVIEGWEELVQPDVDDAALARFAEGRGAGLFRAAGLMIGAAPGDPVAAAGRAWALADLAAHTVDHDLAVRALALVRWPGGRWSRNARPLGAMMHLARMEHASGLARIGRVLVHRMTGF